MAGVSLVAGQIDGAIDEDRQIGIDLNETLEVPLVPVVSAPGFVRDVLEGEGLSGRELHVLHRAVAASHNGGAKHDVELVFRDDEILPESLQTVNALALARQYFIDLTEDGFKVFRRITRRDSVIEGLRFIIEAELLARKHVHPGLQ